MTDNVATDCVYTTNVSLREENVCRSVFLSEGGSVGSNRLDPKHQDNQGKF